MDFFSESLKATREQQQQLALGFPSQLRPAVFPRPYLMIVIPMKPPD